ncbi:hypothetical protein Tco_0256235 [Tanacetum coccineum]
MENANPPSPPESPTSPISRRVGSNEIVEGLDDEIVKELDEEVEEEIKEIEDLGVECSDKFPTNDELTYYKYHCTILAHLSIEDLQS